MTRYVLVFGSALIVAAPFARLGWCAKFEAPFEVKLPDGSIITPESLMVPPKDLSKFFKRVESDMHLRSFGVEILGLGKIKTGILTRVPPRRFGRPEGFAFVWHQKTVKIPGIEVFRTPYGDAIRIFERRVKKDDLAAIIGFQDGRIQGHVHLFGDWPVYYGQWDKGSPSPCGLFSVAQCF